MRFLPMQHTARKPFPSHIIVFLLPALLIYTLFMVYPLFDSLRMSFFDQSVQGQPVFVGLQNFQTLLGDPQWSGHFWTAVDNNFVFFSVHMLVQNPLALLLPTLLTVKQLRGRAIYRTLIFAPTTLSVVIIGFVWSLILSPIWGILDGILKGVGLGGIIQPWLGSDQTALVTVSLISVWQWVGLPMVLFMAGVVWGAEEVMEEGRGGGGSPSEVFTQIKQTPLLPTLRILGGLTFLGDFHSLLLCHCHQR